METINQEVPKWFDGVIGTESEYVKNPYTGEGIELNPLEVAIYDLTMGANHIAEMMDKKFTQTMNPDYLNPNAQKYWEIVRNGISWFRQNNAKAYMVLLD